MVCFWTRGKMQLNMRNKMEITIDKMLLEDMVSEIQESEKTTWVSDPISIGSGDYFLEVKSDGQEVSIRLTQTNLKGLELCVLSVIEDL